MFEMTLILPYLLTGFGLWSPKVYYTQCAAAPLLLDNSEQSASLEDAHLSTHLRTRPLTGPTQPINKSRLRFETRPLTF